MRNARLSAVGKITLSFDFEIGWGDITNPRWRVREKNGVYTRLRNLLPRLLAHLDATDIPVTWATVGGMISDPSDLDFSHLPAEAKSICASALQEGHTTSFDGRDLFDLVLASKAKHHIACHSQTHVPWHYAGVDAGFAAIELSQFAGTLKGYGLTTDRVVFPENREKFYPELQDAGYKVARVSPQKDYAGRAHYLAEQVVGLPPEVLLMEHQSGIIQHSGSMLYNTGPGKCYRLPVVQARALRAVKAVQSGEIGHLHIWAHPFNFAESVGLLAGFKSLLSKIASARDSGSLTIALM